MSIGKPKILRVSVHVLCLVWIVAMAWYIFVLTEGRGLHWQAFDRSIEQKINDCRGSFSERYECKSTLIRERDVANFTWWAERFLIIAGPALLAQAVLFFILNLDARKHESKRVETRLKRLDRQAAEDRRHKLEEGRRQSEIVRLRSEATRRAEAGIKHILLVDREFRVTAPLTRALVECGHDVTSVESLKAALTDFDEAVYDVVMIDIFQEHMGALEGLKGLRGNKYETRVVAMSAGFAKLSDDEVRRAAVKIGVEAILVKPLDLAHIPKTISEIIERPVPEPPVVAAANGEHPHSGTSDVPGADKQTA